MIILEREECEREDEQKAETGVIFINSQNKRFQVKVQV